jgi:hypothetical protein
MLSLRGQTSSELIERATMLVFLSQESDLSVIAHRSVLALNSPMKTIRETEDIDSDR